MQPDSELTMQIDPAEAVVERSATDGLALIPVSIIAMGTPARPIEQLMALQAGLAKIVDLLQLRATSGRARLFQPGCAPTVIREKDHDDH